ncbi:MAG TPA: hypothetical protein VI997_11995 [Candidatus Thermoplasmatota archaeon]|nr:hypothetical protein [Candidatus Thermoplasmatota archaeon]
MDWHVAFLPDAEADLAALARGDVERRDALEAAIRDEFRAWKAARVTRFFAAGTASPSLDRLAGSVYPGSVRVQVFAEYRATVFCLPSYRQAFVVQVFAKGRDPEYRSAVQAHDARLRRYLDDFGAFVARRKR